MVFGLVDQFGKDQNGNPFSYNSSQFHEHEGAGIEI